MSTIGYNKYFYYYDLQLVSLSYTDPNTSELSDMDNTYLISTLLKTSVEVDIF